MRFSNPSYSLGLRRVATLGGFLACSLAVSSCVTLLGDYELVGDPAQDGAIADASVDSFRADVSAPVDTRPTVDTGATVVDTGATAVDTFVKDSGTCSGCDPSVTLKDCCGAACPTKHLAPDCGSYWSCYKTISKELAADAAKICGGEEITDTGSCYALRRLSPVIVYCFGYSGSNSGRAWYKIGGTAAECCAGLSSATKTWG